ncbi:hypothetical protein [Streptomyces sp. NPDC001415]
MQIIAPATAPRPAGAPIDRPHLRKALPLHLADADRAALRSLLRERALLRERRAAVSPGSAGFPPRRPGPGRRAAGLSREQMDLLLDRTPGTYNRFENGQLPTPSAELLTAVATLRPINHALYGPGWVTTCVAEPVTSPGARVMLLIYTPGEPLASRSPVPQASLPS